MTTRRTLVMTLALIGMGCRSLTACSIFMIHDANVVLVGSNEDWYTPGHKISFMPATEDRHGIVYFINERNSAQVGVNDQGLFFDYAAVRRLEVTQSKGKTKVSNGGLMHKVMGECGTVDEALAMFEMYDLSFMEKHQTMICDRK